MIILSQEEAREIQGMLEALDKAIQLAEVVHEIEVKSLKHVISEHENEIEGLIERLEDKENEINHLRAALYALENLK